MVSYNRPQLLFSMTTLTSDRSLSIVWQFFWCWIYAPYILWKSRHIHDTHGWRLQTIGCCLAGLPASPLWLAALYLPEFSPINKYFIPPSWFSVSIFFMEIFTIFIPCYNVWKTNSRRKDTLAVLELWDKQNRRIGNDNVSENKAYSQLSTAIGSGTQSSTHKNSLDSRKSDLLTMSALENALHTNSDQLLNFAALKDFSGENISFLIHLAQWRAAWSSRSIGQMRTRLQLLEELRKLQFHRAALIYSVFISLDLAEFPINISSKAFHSLGMFAAAAKIINQRRNSSDLSEHSATPFDIFDPPPSTPTTGSSFSHKECSSPISTIHPGSPWQTHPQYSTNSSFLDRDWDSPDDDIIIPAEFQPGVFDDAEKEIKYLVLTNTWPKFVNAGCSSLADQFEQEEKSSGGFFCKSRFRSLFP
jgi:hypothetical protein